MHPLRKTAALALAASLLLALAPADAPAQDAHSSRANPRRWRDALRSAELRVRQATDQVTTIRQQATVGSAPPSAVRAAEAELERATLEVSRLSPLAAREDILEALDRPISIALHEATPSQFAAALQAASRIPIEVDPRVPGSLRFSVTAEAVGLAKVLHAVAVHAGLMLAPRGEAWSGVRLSVWPELTVGDRRQVYRGGIAPWSDEWGYAPTGAVQTSAGGDELDGPAAPVVSISRLERKEAPGRGLALASPGPGLIAVAEPLGTEPGSGVRLTVYRLEGETLRQVATTVHRGASGSAAPAGPPRPAAPVPPSRRGPRRR